MTIFLHSPFADMKAAGDASAFAECTADFSALAALGKKGAKCRVSVQNEAQAEMAVRAFFHGAYRVNREGVRALHGQPIFEARESLCDFGGAALCLQSESDLTQAAQRGLAFARCEAYARTLGNLPNNFLHAAELAQYARDLAEARGLSCRVLGEAELRALGCGGILAVNQGSAEEAKLVVLEYGAPGDEPPLALVGKGVMFDAGGYHLKDLRGMDGMKLDMCGAACMLELMEYAALTGSGRRLLAVLPLVENVISPRAVKMGDVLTTLSGQTVEVYNTDAEGRLILCDALTYAQRLGAKTVIDLATLTYGCQNALGDEIGGYFSNSDELALRFEQWARQGGEAFWRLPLADCYRKALQWSDCADLANYAPGKGGAASLAACFLEAFIEPGTQWLHLDVVGPSVRRSETETECKGARGVGMAALAGALQ
ncbi:MAG: M17 family metallopeptidase [Eubacteriales bacterium]|nr:M17 family metallopeptidase [Eubacteriales bacterium]